MTHANAQQDLPHLEYSEDGYIRLTFQHFCRLHFSRRSLFDDNDLLDELLERDIPAVRAGYCDWLTSGEAALVSVGWTWFVTAPDAPRLLAPGGFSSNAMITTSRGLDLGPTRTHELLAAWLSGQTWQNDRPPVSRNRLPTRAHFIH